VGGRDGSKIFTSRILPTPVQELRYKKFNTQHVGIPGVLSVNALKFIIIFIDLLLA
jgi:hypothetical protein